MVEQHMSADAALPMEPAFVAAWLLLALLVHWISTRRTGDVRRQGGESIEGAEAMPHSRKGWCSGGAGAPDPPLQETLAKMLSMQAKPQTTALDWLTSCCTERDKESKATKDKKRKNVHHEPALHPKWCGLRLKDPSDPPPSCVAFSPERPDAALLNDWVGLCCTDDEREGCQKLAELVRGVDGPKDAMTLLRFLRARKQDVQRAADQYTEAIRWYASNPLVSGFYLGTVDASLHRRFDSYWQLQGLLGRDRDGDCISWEGLGRSVFDSCHLLPDEFFLDHQVHSLVRMQQALDEQTKLDGRPHMQYTFVEDLHGLGLQHFKADAFRKYRKCARLGQDYFPETLKRVIIVRAPWIFPKMWNIFQHFFDEGTRNKIIILGDDEMHAGLRKYIDSKWIPKSLGGDLCLDGSPDCFSILPPGRADVPQELVDEILATYAVSE